MAVVISILALLVSVISAVTSWAAARAAVLGHVVPLERDLSDLPGALRFHGITESDLAQAGISPDEFSYLLANSTIGNFYQRLHEPFARSAFPVGHYRRTLCQSADFRRAWPLIRRMMTPGNFVQRVDATIREVEASLVPPDV